MLLTPEQVQEYAAQLPPGWQIDGQALKCDRRFPDFIAAMNFVNKLIEPSESTGHHPDIYISYNRVNITLTTHDAGGLTEKDFALAKVIAAID